MSDLHYNHANVIRFDNRPFNNVEEMNNYIEMELINNIDSKDVLFDLGDMFWKSDIHTIKKVMGYAKPWKFYKAIGNHDNREIWDKNKTLSTEVSDLFDVKIEHEGVRYPLVLCHYPIVSWNQKPRGSWCIHGHCHHNIDKFNENSPDLRVDIGFDGKKLLWSFEDLLEYMKKKAKTDNFYEYAQTKITEL